MDKIEYPKLDVEKWKNSKLTLVERDEISRYINEYGWSHKRVAELYHVSRNTVMYWSDPTYRAKDNARTTKRMKINMMDPAFKKRQTDRQKLNTMKRKREDPVYREWTKHGIRGTRSVEQKERDMLKARARYSSTHQETIKLRARRQYRARDLNGFRMFMKHINIPDVSQVSCYKNEMISTNSSKGKNVSITKSSRPMAKKLHTTLQHITKIISQPIHVLKRVFLNE